MIDQELLICFLDEALDSLSQWERACLDLETTPAPEVYQTLFRAAHNLKGASRTVGLEQFGAFVHCVEDLIKLLMEAQVPLDATLLSFLLEAQVKLVEWIELLREDSSAEAAVQDLSARIKEVTSNPKAYLSGGESSSATSEPAPENPLTSHANAEKNEMDELEALFLAAKNEYDGGGAKTDTAPTPPVPEAVQASAGEGAQSQAGKPQETKSHKADETIRISAHKLDELLQLIGELSIHQSIVFQGRKAGTLDSRICQNAIHLTNKTVKDLYSKALSLRMQPVQSLFQRLERVARDVARAQDKKIKIELEGTEVELDKTVIERITDPLIHILRNAVDHGVDTHDERVAAGKSEIATVKLSATQDPAGVCIKVAEDGRGLNREKILKKAIEKGLVPANHTLTVRQVNNLIFLPGFSTADKVTDISGRGVGMDVVTKAVQALQGSIEIQSDQGKGTTFAITLPTSLSIVDALVVKISEVRYAVAMHELTEIIDLSEFSIDSTGNKGKMISLRGEVVPIQNLNDYFKVPIVKKAGQVQTVQGKPALVVREGSASIAFEVDNVLGQQQVVVRPLSTRLSAIPGFSGSMILGDGEPGMIVSLNEVARTYLKTANLKEARA